MDLKALYTEAARHFGEGVAGVADDQWSNATPDTEWDVRALVNHVTGETLWIPDLLAGKTIAEVGSKYDGDVLGDDPKAVWAKALQKAVAAVEACEDLTSNVHLSFGDMPVKDYLGQMIIDATVHSWDLAQGLKSSGAGPGPHLINAAYELLVPQAEDWRKGGAFGPEIKVPDDASLGVKLLALTGRRA
ncbi:MAG TPA: TIGR03086 family metal-binding protein [Candidatus Saccharimonadales bacterium]|nr:TIGR03086 family metal-binding protein [Candidatus Saccharimonadales bacterium]